MIKQRPILFSTPMIFPIQEDIKTQTRRTKGLKVVNQYPDKYSFVGYEIRKNVLFAKFTTDLLPMPLFIPCPYGLPGDFLYVRETWQYINDGEDNSGYVYKASQNGRDWEENSEDWKWKPSLFMPKKAARIFLRITDIRVERLQDITEEDAQREGVYYQQHLGWTVDGDTGNSESAIGEFIHLWEKINGPGSWERNEWLWVVSFERIDKPTNI